MPDRISDSEKINALRDDYTQNRAIADRLLQCLRDQLGAILDQRGIALGVPMETRIKTLDSLIEKLDRKALEIASVREIEDFVGIRLILLFRGDVETLDEVIKSTFDVVTAEDTSSRLGATQFGYQSNHYVIRIPEEWRKVPNYSDLNLLTAEIQVRTLAQHMWAAASHKLQYKREESVPLPLRRTIHRVSALLETVDLEFSRVLDERSEYVEQSASDSTSDSYLNVDTLRTILDEMLPKENRKEDEDYDLLLKDLNILKVTRASELREIIRKHIDTAKKRDNEIVLERKTSGNFMGTSADRIARGIFYTHVGLARQCLKGEFGVDRVDAVIKDRLDPAVRKRKRAPTTPVKKPSRRAPKKV